MLKTLCWSLIQLRKNARIYLFCVLNPFNIVFSLSSAAPLSPLQVAVASVCPVARTVARAPYWTWRSSSNNNCTNYSCNNCSCSNNNTCNSTCPLALAIQRPVRRPIMRINVFALAGRDRAHSCHRRAPSRHCPGLSRPPQYQMWRSSSRASCSAAVLETAAAAAANSRRCARAAWSICEVRTHSPLASCSNGRAACFSWLASLRPRRIHRRCSARAVSTCPLPAAIHRPPWARPHGRAVCISGPARTVATVRSARAASISARARTAATVRSVSRAWWRLSVAATLTLLPLAAASPATASNWDHRRYIPRAIDWLRHGMASLRWDLSRSREM